MDKIFKHVLVFVFLCAVGSSSLTIASEIESASTNVPKIRNSLFLTMTNLESGIVHQIINGFKNDGKNINETWDSKIDPKKKRAIITVDLFGYGQNNITLKYFYSENKFLQNFGGHVWMPVENDIDPSMRLNEALSHVTIYPWCDKLKSFKEKVINVVKDKDNPDKVADAVDTIKNLSPSEVIKKKSFSYQEGEFQEKFVVDDIGFIKTYELKIKSIIRKQIKNNIEKNASLPIVEQAFMLRREGKVPIYFSDASITVEKDFCFKKSILGIIFMKFDDGYYVNNVYNPSPAWSFGVRSGFKILKIDGVEIFKLDEDAVRILLNEGLKTSFIFSNREGKQISLTLEKNSNQNEAN